MFIYSILTACRHIHRVLRGCDLRDCECDSGDLPPGTHTLVAPAEDDQPVWADHFLVSPNPPGSVNTNPSSLSYPGSTPTAVPKPKHKSTPAGVIVGPIIGVLALTAVAVAVFFFWRCRRREHESPDRPAREFTSHSYLYFLLTDFNKVQMSTANVFDAEHTFAHAGHNVPPIAGPPPLSHGYSSHSQVGLFPTPNSYNDPSSTLATAGVSCTDPDSPLAPPSRHRSPTTTMPSTRYPSTSTSNQGHGTPQTSTSPPNSDPAAQEPQASAGGGARAPAACSL